MLPELDVRPRSAWEALDLGTLLARRHLPRLMAAWALMTIPLFVLLSLLCWRHPGLAFLLFWWLKPLYERLPLYMLSRAVFGSTPSIGQGLRALPAQLGPQWFASLTWRRLSPTRSFDLPVVQLEGLAGEPRRQRLALLGQRDSGIASWLTVVGLHLEFALLLGLIALFYFVLPQQLVEGWSWQELLNDTADWLWFEHLSNFLYVLVLIVWEPVYVACGFSLYLNRRTLLEGWDIELGFRHLRQRLMGGLGLTAAVALVLALSIVSEPTLAEAQASDPSLPVAEARRQVETLLQQPPFAHEETVTRWRLGDGTQTERQLPDWLTALGQALGRLDALADALQVLLWSGLLAVLVVSAWRYREWLSTFGGRRRKRRRRRPTAGLMFELDSTAQSLPADVAVTAEQLWATDPSGALSLLYRGMLSQLGEQLPSKPSLTEAELLQSITTLGRIELTLYAGQLTQHWQNLAYGHRRPPDEARESLCDGYRQLFLGRKAP